MNLLREYIRELLTEQLVSDEEKIIMLFFRDSSRLGIQMAEMTPGFESLAEDLDNFRALVIEFIDSAERVIKDRSVDVVHLGKLRAKIEREAVKLVKQLPSRVHTGAMTEWILELFWVWSPASQAGWLPGWSKEDQAKLDDLKDWARA